MRNKKLWYFILIMLVFIFFTILTMRVVSGEDDWICESGQWVKHGQPSSPMPNEQCK